MMKLTRYPEIHCALRDAFFASFELEEYECTGPLRLELEERERIKAEMIKPELDGYKEFLIALEEDDDDAIEQFELFAESVTNNLERQCIEWMKQQLR